MPKERGLEGGSNTGAAWPPVTPHTRNGAWVFGIWRQLGSGYNPKPTRPNVKGQFAGYDAEPALTVATLGNRRYRAVLLSAKWQVLARTGLETRVLVARGIRICITETTAIVSLWFPLCDIEHCKGEKTMPRLYSYVVQHDSVFAPNPFYGFCTLATCKPKIRKTACPGDWILGTVPKPDSPEPRAIYAMRVTETLSYNEYRRDSRFREKRPDIGAVCGDNIYCRNADGQTDRVLISDNFIYWGSAAPFLPPFAGMDVRAGRGHKCRFPDETIQAFVAWFRGCQARGVTGYCGHPTQGKPGDWPSGTETGL